MSLLGGSSDEGFGHAVRAEHDHGCQQGTVWACAPEGSIPSIPMPVICADRGLLSVSHLNVINGHTEVVCDKVGAFVERFWSTRATGKHEGQCDQGEWGNSAHARTLSGAAA